MIRLPWASVPQETRFFLIIAGWAGGLGIVYWFASYEVAGTALLAGLALATGAMAAWLIAGRRRAADGSGEGGPGLDPDARDTSGGGTAGVDRPFLDEEGRIPDASLAPFALGLGIALAALGPIFGVAPVAVGAVAIAWGAWGWFSGARDELDALERDG